MLSLCAAMPPPVAPPLQSLFFLSKSGLGWLQGREGVFPRHNVGSERGAWFHSYISLQNTKGCGQLGHIPDAEPVSAAGVGEGELRKGVCFLLQSLRKRHALDPEQRVKPRNLLVKVCQLVL